MTIVHLSVFVHVCESVSVCFDIDELYRAAVKQISFSVTLVFLLVTSVSVSVTVSVCLSSSCLSFSIYVCPSEYLSNQRSEQIWVKNSF